MGVLPLVPDFERHVNSIPSWVSFFVTFLFMASIVILIAGDIGNLLAEKLKVLEEKNVALIAANAHAAQITRFVIRDGSTELRIDASAARYTALAAHFAGVNDGLQRGIDADAARFARDTRHRGEVDTAQPNGVQGRRVSVDPVVRDYSSGFGMQVHREERREVQGQIDLSLGRR